jgi:hypothetical protein
MSEAIVTIKTEERSEVITIGVSGPQGPSSGGGGGGLTAVNVDSTLNKTGSPTAPTLGVKPGSLDPATYMTVNPLDRANHFGTMLAQVISDFTAAVNAIVSQSGTPANPLTTQGDMIVAGPSGAQMRLSAGLEDMYLAIVNGYPTWKRLAMMPGTLLTSSYGVTPSATNTDNAAGLASAKAAFLADDDYHTLIVDHIGIALTNDEWIFEDDANDPNVGARYSNKKIMGLSSFATGIRQTDLSKGIMIFRANVTGNGPFTFANFGVSNLALTWQGYCTRQNTRAFGIAFENMNDLNTNNAFLFGVFDQIYIESGYVGWGIRSNAITWQPTMSGVVLNGLYIPTPTFMYDNGFSRRYKVIAAGTGTTGSSEPAWRYGNTTITTVGGINVSVTTFTVANAGDFIPATVPFTVIVDSEQMTVTNISGSTLTVTRGVNGTTAATHTAGAAVKVVISGSNGIQFVEDGPTQYVAVWAMNLAPTYMRIHDVASQAIKWAGGYAVGSPENVIGLLYCQQWTRSHTVAQGGIKDTNPKDREPLFELESVECGVSATIGIEDAENDLMRFQGDETFNVGGTLHLERIDVNVADASLIRGKYNIIKIHAARIYDVDFHSNNAYLARMDAQTTGIFEMNFRARNYSNASNLYAMRGGGAMWRMTANGATIKPHPTWDTDAADSLVEFNGVHKGGTVRQTLTGNAQTLTPYVFHWDGTQRAIRQQIRITTAASRTALLMTAGQMDGQVVEIENGQGFTLDWNTTDNTSLVLGSTTAQVAANSTAKFTWNFSLGAAGLWIKQK